MRIKNKTVFVYDIESFPNLFTCTILNTENGNTLTYEISSRKNDYHEMCKTFINDYIYFCGYNNSHYDDIIMNYCIIEFQRLYHFNSLALCKDLKSLSDKIIESERISPTLRMYKNNNAFKSFDLMTMLYSKKNRVGLKVMQVTMHYDKVLEYNGNFNMLVSENKIDDVIYYNTIDVLSTNEILKNNEQEINLRLDIEKEYGINVLSKDGVGIGETILKTKYLQKTGKDWNLVKDRRSPCETVNLSKIIFPFISYETEVFNQMLCDLKSQEKLVVGSKFEKSVIFEDVFICLGSGGVHSKNSPEIIIPKDDELLIDIDARSMYASLIINHQIVPKHLGNEFLEVYESIYKERLEAVKSGDKLRNKVLKLAINSVTGNLQNEFSWLYDPECAYKLRINGQLLMLKYVEMINLSTNCKIVNINTDGVFILIKKDKLDTLKQVTKEFEELSKLSMEFEYFESLYQQNVNSYIAVYDGYSKTKDPSLIKTKGFFGKQEQGKGMSPNIIKKSIIEYFINGVPVDKTLKGSTDIRDFLTYQRIGKEYRILYGDEVLNQHINRFYMSPRGRKMFKFKYDYALKMHNKTDLCSTSGVIIVNDLNGFDFSKASINYLWYKIEIYKIIDQLEDSLNPKLF